MKLAIVAVVAFWLGHVTRNSDLRSTWGLLSIGVGLAAVVCSVIVFGWVLAAGLASVL